MKSAAKGTSACGDSLAKALGATLSAPSAVPSVTSEIEDQSVPSETDHPGVPSKIDPSVLNDEPVKSVKVESQASVPSESTEEYTPPCLPGHSEADSPIESSVPIEAAEQKTAECRSRHYPFRMQHS